MINLEQYYKDQEIPQEMQSMLNLVGNEPSIESIWALMDLVWIANNTDENNPNSLSKFYMHPVWTLNGFFTEWHEESIYNRQRFADYIANTSPKRVADYGGGFGAFARNLAEKSSNIAIEIVEPFPSEIAINLSKKYPNITFVSELTGKYDVIVALDVLEHVEEPLNLVYKISQHIDKKGYLLLANCFHPVIKCHLPSTFYLRHTFDFLLKKMGLSMQEKLVYGRIYTLAKSLCEPKEISHWVTIAKISHPVLDFVKPLVKWLLGFIKK